VAFPVRLATGATGHLEGLTARERATVLARVREQLTQQPTVETRNRKRMRPNPLAPWELRVGDLRVYYDVTDPPDVTVVILALGRKQGNKVFVGGEEVIP